MEDSKSLQKNPMSKITGCCPVSIKHMKVSNSLNYYVLSIMALQLLAHEETLQHNQMILFQLCRNCIELMMFTNIQ